MDSKQLASIAPDRLDFSEYSFGMPQRSGNLTAVPLFGPNRSGNFTSPLSGLKLNRVNGYGNLELHNPSTEGIAIVPLHMGYIQDGAQNHALCRSAFIAAGQKLMFEDACCVQAAQGGYLEEREQWFFILPLQLRSKALELRGKKSYNKLWDEITKLNVSFSLERRGHLEQIISRKRAWLTQYQTRFELLPQQIGALFLLNDRLVGMEIAPNAAYFAELWMPLVCFCYGVAAMTSESQASNLEKSFRPFAANSLLALRDKLHQSRLQFQEKVSTSLAKTPKQSFKVKEEECFLDLTLKTCTSHQFAGQFVVQKQQLVYLSLFAKPEYFVA
ncbi:MAG: ARPP-1 family domain-containing protein [Microcoleus sp.]